MNNKLKFVSLLAGVLVLPVCGAVYAEAAPEHTFTANVSLTNNYIFRGLTQTWDKAALQGGADYAHAAGWYAGVWGSTVSGNEYPGGSGLELDYYGGYNGKFTEDFGWTAGLYGYYYPGANYNKAAAPGADQTFDNLEWNVGVSYKWLSVKLSSSLTDYFGANAKTGYTSGSKGSTYFDATATIPLTDDLALALHYGRTDVKANLNGPTVGGSRNPDYSDYKLALTKTYKDGWNIGAAYAYAGNGAYYDRTASFANSETKNLGGGHWLVSAGRTF